MWLSSQDIELGLTMLAPGLDYDSNCDQGIETIQFRQHTYCCILTWSDTALWSVVRAMESTLETWKMAR